MATPSEVQSLYIAYFGRPADPEGLTYWTTGVGSSVPLEDIADGFAATPEYTASIEGLLPNQVIVEFYDNLFGRDASEIAPFELEYWVNTINEGNTTLQQVAVFLAQAALQAAPSDPDRIALESKILASAQWTAEIGLTTEGILAYTGENGILAGQAYLDPVVDAATTPTLDQTRADVAAFIATGGPGPNNVALTTGVDVLTSASATLDGTAVSFRFSDGNQTVTADGSTLTSGDTLQDPFTTDSDTLTVENLTLLNLLPANDNTGVGTLNIANIENLNFDLAGGSGRYDFPDIGFANVQTITVTGTAAANNIITGFEDWDNTGATTFDASALTGTTVGTNFVRGNSEGGQGYFLIEADANPGNLTVRGSQLANYIETDDGADTIFDGSDRDYIDAQLGADTVNLSGGNDIFQFDFGDGGGQLVGTTGLPDAAGFIYNNGDTLSFSGQIDTINGFNQSEDAIDGIGNRGATNLFGLSSQTNLENTAGFIRGNWAGTTFTVSDAGSSTLVIYTDNTPGNTPIADTIGDADFILLNGFTGVLGGDNFI